MSTLDDARMVSLKDKHRAQEKAALEAREPKEKEVKKLKGKVKK